MDTDNYQEFDMPKWSTKINHLAYADDAIIFSSVERNSLAMIKEVLHEYEGFRQKYEASFPNTWE